MEHMVTINCSLLEAAVIVEALVELRKGLVVTLNDSEASTDEVEGARYGIWKIDKLSNRVLDAGEPVVYDALGIKVKRQ